VVGAVTLQLLKRAATAASLRKCLLSIPCESTSSWGLLSFVVHPSSRTVDYAASDSIVRRASTRATAVKPDVTEPRRLALKWDSPCLIPFTRNGGRHLSYRDPDFPAPPCEGVPRSR